MKKSTSFHSLNADGKLNFFGKRLWKFLNFLNNIYFPRKFNNFHLEKFTPEISESDRLKIPDKASPSRFLSDLFWMKLNWNVIRSELGEIHVLDSGAGSGKYGIKINEFSSGISSYTGLDLAPDKAWQSLMENHTYITMKQHHSDDILSVIPKNINMFMSQSAIEHFKYDLLYFRQIRQFIEKKRAPIIQVHIFPSAACLKLYGLHGVRQYTPRTVSSIAALFDGVNHSSTLYHLGGRNCNELHYRYITEPLVTSKGTVDYRDTKTDEYKKLLAEAVRKDMDEALHKLVPAPSFYALVIQSYFKQSVI